MGDLPISGSMSSSGFEGSAAGRTSTPEMRAAIDVIRNNANPTDAQVQTLADAVNNAPNQAVRDARMRTLDKQGGIPKEVVDKVKTGKTAIKAGAAIEKGIKAAAKAALAAAEAEAVAVVASTATTAETAATSGKTLAELERSGINWLTRTVNGTGAEKAATAVVSSGAMKTAVSIAGKVAPAATYIAAGVQVVSIATSPTERGNVTAWTEAAGSVAGSYLFGAAGAAAGTVSLPGAGTAVGAMGGSMAGAKLGKAAGTLVGGTIEIMANLYTAYSSPSANPVDVGVSAGVRDISSKPAVAKTGVQGGVVG